MSPPPPLHPDRVAAVVAALDPPASLVDATRETLRQVGRVVVVDDGSGPASAPLFAALEDLGAEVLHRPNGGIAAALNTGLEHVRRTGGAPYVLTLDQDSRLGPDYVVRALATAARLERARVGYGVVAAESYRGHRSPTDGGVDLLEGRVRWAFDPMQSGWLLPARTVAAVGLLEEGLVIDAVDSEYTARCRAHGLPPAVGEGCALEHGQGERRPARVLGRAVGGFNRHSPLRVRYLTRNGTLLTRRYLATQPRWVLRRLATETVAHLLRLAFDHEQRGALVRAVVLGWRDGLLGRTGRIEG
ncbi:glycosyltransferase [Lapillicoccus jejuensis]|uniref:Rhamnosyltransferase n=1 Tax=Lapillicoccus jejuensis TaxID=402171 RepID=A0A542E0B4_9MICO|nr:glycosyltransferase [Lapillicoccus jejuensis]TQJ08719.1 rhamnosyltransferase [Lapillicoccus jejuensis]